MNSVNILGRLSSDVEFIDKGDFKVAKFNLAHTKKLGKDKQETLFIGCVAFNKMAEVVNTYFKKGERILINGELKQETWQDSQGNAKSTYKIHILSLDFIETKGQSDNQKSNAKQNATKPNNSQNQVSMTPQEFFGDEIPF
ncbi:MAG TPA: hypothetical protein DEQ48_03575 [Helicobacter sp.]|nr:hypothetical protein [Helicobacter sp.]